MSLKIQKLNQHQDFASWLKSVPDMHKREILSDVQCFQLGNRHSVIPHNVSRLQYFLFGYIQFVAHTLVKPQKTTAIQDHNIFALKIKKK